MTNLDWGVLCDQDQALDAVWRAHGHHRGDLSPKAIAEDVGFFNLEGVHGTQHSLGNLSPVRSGPVLETKGRGRLTRSKL